MGAVPATAPPSKIHVTAVPGEILKYELPTVV